MHSGPVLLQLTRECLGLQKEFIGCEMWAAFLSTALVRGKKKKFGPINSERVTPQMCTKILYIRLSLKLPDINKNWSP
jgi:hypothetical protein